jgi:hypothetical protein
MKGSSHREASSDTPVDVWSMAMARGRHRI